MKNIAQKIVLTNLGGCRSHNLGSKHSGLANVPRALLDYLGKMALGDEDLQPGSDRAKNCIRGRIAYK